MGLVCPFRPNHNIADDVGLVLGIGDPAGIFRAT